jgi:hypothetical protein
MSVIFSRGRLDSELLPSTAAASAGKAKAPVSGAAAVAKKDLRVVYFIRVTNSIAKDRQRQMTLMKRPDDGRVRLIPDTCIKLLPADANSGRLPIHIRHARNSRARGDISW